MAKKRTTLTIKGIGVLDARCDTYLGKVIDYVKQTPLHQNNKGIAIEMLFARFLPLVLETNDSSNRAIAIECAIKCETWARVIRELWGLNEPRPAYPKVYSLPQIERDLPLTNDLPLNTNTLSSGADRAETGKLAPQELAARAKELEEFEQMLIEIVDSSSSVWSAKDKLVEMQPIEDEDWTQAQWDLWNKYTTKQEDIIDQQLLGDLAPQLKGGSDRDSGEKEVKS
ncbi:hypothetical protein IQ255_30190 [Pleurocapsales cyanobacterium LEGE 10410]|nr:hypothetical protein [Pleurocapsales cyanobacterium LEGE 10410]